jgi:hypothetical protein
MQKLDLLDSQFGYYLTDYGQEMHILEQIFSKSRSGARTKYLIFSV